MSDPTPTFQFATRFSEINPSQAEATASIVPMEKGNQENYVEDVAMAGSSQDATATPIKSGGDGPAFSISSSSSPAINNNNNNTTPALTKDTMTGGRLANDANSRAGSIGPAAPADRAPMPTEAAAHGAPTRQYLNSKVTYHILEGMKIVAKEQPADPLRVLGQFLLKRSAEVELAGANGTNRDPDKDGDEDEQM